MGSGGWHPRLTTWVDRVDARWQQLGVSTSQRRELRIELVTDLSQARLAGAPLEDLLSIDPVRFASDVAVAHGLNTSGADAVAQPRTSSLDSEIPAPDGLRGVTVARVAVAGLLGSVVGGVVSLLVALPFVGWVGQHAQEGGAAQIAAMLATYVVAALVAALCGGLAVSSACADSPSAKLLGHRAATGLLISGAVATLVTVSFAKATDFSTETPVVLGEVGLVMGTCLVGLVLVARSTRPMRRGVLGTAR